MSLTLEMIDGIGIYVKLIQDVNEEYFAELGSRFS